MAGILVLPLAPALLPLLAALLLAGAAALGYLIGQTLERSPWPLFLIAQGVANVFVGTIRLVVTWASDGVINAATSMAAVFLNPAIAILHTTWAVGDVAAALWGLRTAIVPYIVALYTQGVWARLMQEVADRTNAVNALFWTAYAWVQGLYGDLVQLSSQLTALAYQLYQAAVAHADQGTAGALAHADQVGAQVLSQAQQLSEGDRAFTRAVGSTALGYTQAVGLALERDLGLAEQELESYTDAAVRGATGYAAALAAIVAGYAAARSNALAEAVNAIEQSPCQRFCAPLGGIGDWVQDLEEAGLVAALIALAAQGVRDPAGTARDVADTFAGPLNAAAAELRQAAGV